MKLLPMLCDDDLVQTSAVNMVFVQPKSNVLKNKSTTKKVDDQGQKKDKDESEFTAKEDKIIDVKIIVQKSFDYISNIVLLDESYRMLKQ